MNKSGELKNITGAILGSGNLQTPNTSSQANMVFVPSAFFSGLNPGQEYTVAQLNNSLGIGSWYFEYFVGTEPIKLKGSSSGMFIEF